MDGIRFAPGSFDNRMEYVDVRSTSEGIRIDSLRRHGQAEAGSAQFLAPQLAVLRADSRYAKVDAYGVCFSEAADAVVRLTGGRHEFIQCTISNYYLFSAVSEPLLSLYHCLPESGVPANDNPLVRASFENCIVYGTGSDINEGDLTGSQVFLRNAP